MSPAASPERGSAPNPPRRPRHDHPGHVRLSGSRGPTGEHRSQGGYVGRRLSATALVVVVAAGGGSFSLTDDGRQLCKPAGATVVALKNGNVLYWDALEGTENIELSIVLEFAEQARKDRSRTIDLSGPQPVFGTPDPADAGANPDGNESNPLPIPSVPLPLPGGNGDTTANDGDLFCADQV